MYKYMWAHTQSMGPKSTLRLKRTLGPSPECPAQSSWSLLSNALGGGGRIASISFQAISKLICRCCSIYEWSLTWGYGLMFLIFVNISVAGQHWRVHWGIVYWKFVRDFNMVNSRSTIIFVNSCIYVLIRHKRFYTHFFTQFFVTYFGR